MDGRRLDIMDGRRLHILDGRRLDILDRLLLDLLSLHRLRLLDLLLRHRLLLLHLPRLRHRLLLLHLTRRPGILCMAVAVLCVYTVRSLHTCLYMWPPLHVYICVYTCGLLCMTIAVEFHGAGSLL